MEIPDATDFQIKVGRKLGIDLRGKTRKVAAAEILDKIAPVIDIKATLFDPNHEEPTEKQIKYEKSAFGIDVSEDSYRVASAKISDAQLKRNLEAMDAKELSEGDNVVFTEEWEGQVIKKAFTISTIKPNGHIFFKGSSAPAAWAFQVEKIPDGFEPDYENEKVQFWDHRVD